MTWCPKKTGGFLSSLFWGEGFFLWDRVRISRWVRLCVGACVCVSTSQFISVLGFGAAAEQIVVAKFPYVFIAHALSIFSCTMQGSSVWTSYCFFLSYFEALPTAMLSGAGVSKKASSHKAFSERDVRLGVHWAQFVWPLAEWMVPWDNLHSQE